MGKKKQQSIDTHLKFAGGGGTGANHDVIELSGAEDDTAMDVSNMVRRPTETKLQYCRKVFARVYRVQAKD